MTKRKKKRRVIISFLILLLLMCFILYYFLFGRKDNEHLVVNEIKEYGYTLELRDTALMADIFNKLKSTLNDDAVDYEQYAIYLSELFIIDLYTIDNKVNMYDVGGDEYVYPDHKDNYKKKVEDTLYKYLVTEKKRKLKMPIVDAISNTGIEETHYTYLEKEYPAYDVELTWNYKSKSKYDTSGKVTIVNIDDKLFVAEFIPEVSKWKDYLKNLKK